MSTGGSLKGGACLCIFVVLCVVIYFIVAVETVLQDSVKDKPRSHASFDAIEREYNFRQWRF